MSLTSCWDIFFILCLYMSGDALLTCWCCIFIMKGLSTCKLPLASLRFAWLSWILVWMLSLIFVREFAIWSNLPNMGSLRSVVITIDYCALNERESRFLSLCIFITVTLWELAPFELVRFFSTKSWYRNAISCSVLLVKSLSGCLNSFSMNSYLTWSECFFARLLVAVGVFTRFFWADEEP